MKNRDKQSHTDCMTSLHISDAVTWVSIGCISQVGYTAAEAESGSFSDSGSFLTFSNGKRTSHGSHFRR